MSLRYLDTLNDFKYNGKDITIKIYHEDSSGSNPLYKIEFEYKNCSVYYLYHHNDQRDLYFWTPIYCSIIDKFGEEGVKLFKECKEKLLKIKKNYILLAQLSI